MSNIDQFGKLTDLKDLKVIDLEKAGLRVEPRDEKKRKANGQVAKAEVKPADGKAMAAAKEEVKAEEKPEDDKNVKFEFDDEEYTVPPVDKWSVRVFEAQEEGKIVTTVKLLLGPEQWEKFMSKPNPKHKDRRVERERTLTEMNSLFMAAQDALGFESGD